MSALQVVIRDHSSPAQGEIALCVFIIFFETSEANSLQ
jgi:hypothetical protein